MDHPVTIKGLICDFINYNLPLKSEECQSQKRLFLNKKLGTVLGNTDLKPLSARSMWVVAQAKQPPLKRDAGRI